MKEREEEREKESELEFINNIKVLAPKKTAQTFNCIVYFDMYKIKARCMSSEKIEQKAIGNRNSC